MVSTATAQQLEDAQRAFWRRCIRLPSEQRTGMKHIVCVPQLSDPLWLTSDDKLAHTTHISLSQYVGRDCTNPTAARIPTIHVVVEGTDFDGDHLEHQVAIQARLGEHSLPTPQFWVYSPEGEGSHHLVWCIQPLRLPRNKDHQGQHSSFGRQLNAWTRARLKIAVMLEDLGGVASRDEALCPLPHEAPLLGPMADAYLLQAEPDLAAYRIREVSEPLDNTPWDALARKLAAPELPDAANLDVDAEGQGAVVFRLPPSQWLKLPRYLEANAPQALGERHNAAKVMVCHQRWAGWSFAEIAQDMRRWNAMQRHPLPEDELFHPEHGLVVWAVRKLAKGGPTGRKAEPQMRGRYSRSDDQVDAVVAFLRGEGATSTPWVGSYAELAKQTSVETGVVVTRRSLERHKDRLTAKGVKHQTLRQGRSTISSWSVLPTEAGEANPDDPVTPPTSHRVVAASLLPNPGLQQSLSWPSQNPISDRAGEGDPQNEGLVGERLKSNSSMESSPAEAAARLINEDLREAKELLGVETFGGNDISHRDFSLKEPPEPSSADQTNKPEKQELGGRAGEALIMLQKGLSLLPLVPGQKDPCWPLLPREEGRPTWSPLARQKPSEAVVLGWFAKEPEVSIGIPCGRVSGVVVLDLDSSEAVAWAQDTLPKPMFRVATGRDGGGQHWYYRYPEGAGQVGNAGSFQGRADIQVRGDGGYVVAPGSVHKSGRTYEILDELQMTKGATFDLAWLKSDIKGRPPMMEMTPLQLRRQRALAARSGNASRLRELSVRPAHQGRGQEPELEALMAPVRALVAEGRAAEAEAAYKALFLSAPEWLLPKLMRLWSDLK